MSTTMKEPTITPNAGYGLVRGVKYYRTKKAYRINLDKIEEGYLYCEESCFAENQSKAKSILIKRSACIGMSLKYFIEPEEVNFKNLPVVRYNIADKFLFESDEKTMEEIEFILNERDRQKGLDDILKDSKIKYCYIKKGIYYRPSYAGYTEHKKFAGVYPKKDAISHARGVCEITIVPIDIIEHNAMINSEIDNLKTRLL